MKVKVMNNDETSNEETSVKSREFTDIVGSSGRWQLRILFMSMCCDLISAWHHLCMSFLAYPVDHWCARPYDSVIPLEIWKKKFLPNTTVKGKLHHSQCEMFTNNHSENIYWNTSTKPCENWEYSMEFNSLINHFNLVCDKDWMLSTSQSIYMCGFLLSVLICGQAADRYGRHPVFMVSMAIFIFSGIATAFADSFLTFTILRFVVAFGCCGMSIVSFVLCIESFSPLIRTKYMVVQCIGFPIGFVLLSPIAWLVKDWFYLQLILTLPGLLIFSGYWLISESPRWLLSHGMLDEAICVLKKVAKINRIAVKDLEEECKMLYTQESEKKTLKQNVTVIHLLRSPNLRKRTLSMYYIWMAIAFAYYALSLNTNQLEGNEYLNFFIAGIMDVLSAIYAMVTLDRWGRKKPLAFALLFGGLFCFICILIPQSYAAGKTALAMSGKLLVGGAFATVYIYAAEIFPTVARNVGLGSCSSVARIGSIASPFMRDLGKVTNAYVPVVLCGVLIIIAGLLVLTLPETNHLPMPETIAQAEHFGIKEKSRKYSAEMEVFTNQQQSSDISKEENV